MDENVKTTIPLKMPRGIRNCNPLNIRRTKDKWRGLLEEQKDEEFFQFHTFYYGWRAAIIIITKSYRALGLRTISQIIRRWAPSNENDTETYIGFVEKYSGVNRDEVLAPFPRDMEKYRNIFIAMSKFEIGYLWCNNIVISRLDAYLDDCRGEKQAV